MIAVLIAAIASYFAGYVHGYITVERRLLRLLKMLEKEEARHATPQRMQ